MPVTRRGPTTRTRAACSGGEHRYGAPDVVHRLAQLGRQLPGTGRGKCWPRRFGAVLVVLVLAHDSIALWRTRLDCPR
uniref:Uncharacterized protein n=1 Tax=Streptomyces sp. F12 TaxID=1436084 RepID=V9Z8U8_9ACTN|nr:hypothetical protein pFRL6_342 [Streptomyces sp. F12]